MTKYNKGDIVSIPATVDSAFADGSMILKLTKFNGQVFTITFHEDKVLTVVEKAVPPEPEPACLLKDGNGDLWSWRGNGWSKVDGSSRTRSWGPEMYKQFGPFEFFTPGGKV